MPGRPIFRQSAETIAIIQALDTLSPGDETTYDALSATVGFEVHGGVPAFQSAKKALLREDKVFEVIRGRGVKRLTDSEILSSTVRQVRAIRRTARFGSRKLVAIEDESCLSNSQQLDLTVKRGVFAIVQQASSRSGENKIQKVAEASPTMTELPVSHVAAALLGSVSASIAKHGVTAGKKINRSAIIARRTAPARAMAASLKTP